MNKILHVKILVFISGKSHLPLEISLSCVAGIKNLFFCLYLPQMITQKEIRKNNKKKTVSFNRFYL